MPSAGSLAWWAELAVVLVVLLLAILVVISRRGNSTLEAFPGMSARHSSTAHVAAVTRLSTARQCRTLIQAARRTHRSAS